jgi:hypothetical protein
MSRLRIRSEPSILRWAPRTQDDLRFRLHTHVWTEDGGGRLLWQCVRPAAAKVIQYGAHNHWPALFVFNNDQYLAHLTIWLQLYERQARKRNIQHDAPN